jgi:malate dehydrogenase
MSIVAVVGASLLGGSIAHRLAAQPSVREVRLIDSSVSVAEGTALDIQQAGPVEQFDTTVVGMGNLHDVVGADIVVLAGPVGAADLEWSEKDGLAVLEQVARLNHHALAVCAGSTHRSLVERAVANTSMTRRRVIGSAPFALAAAIKAIVALELRCSASDVSLAVLGRPPQQLVVPWSEASVRGVTVPQLLEPQRLARLQQKVNLLWPPGPYTLAAAAARLCDSVSKGTADRGFPCYVVLTGELGVRDHAVAMTVELDGTGVSRVIEPVLSVRERTQLESALRI